MEQSRQEIIDMQVVEWVLGSVRSVWSDAGWQQHLATLPAFLSHYMPLQTSPQGSVEVLSPLALCLPSRCIVVLPLNDLNALSILWTAIVSEHHRI